MKSMNWDRPKEILMMAQWQGWPRIQAQIEIQIEIIFFFAIMKFIGHLICHIGIDCPVHAGRILYHVFVNHINKLHVFIKYTLMVLRCL